MAKIFWPKYSSNVGARNFFTEWNNGICTNRKIMDGYLQLIIANVTNNVLRIFWQNFHSRRLSIWTCHYSYKPTMGRTYNGKDISAAWGVALARHPRMHPVGLQVGSHSASLSAEQGSWVPGRLLYTSLRHSQPRHLRSTTRHYPTVPRYRLNTFGRSAFFVAGAGPTAWN